MACHATRDTWQSEPQWHYVLTQEISAAAPWCDRRGRGGELAREPWREKGEIFFFFPNELKVIYHDLHAPV